MNISTKVIIFSFVITVIILAGLMKNGYRVVPLVKFTHETTARGTTVTGLKIEMYNPIKDKELFEKIRIERANKNKQSGDNNNGN